MAAAGRLREPRNGVSDAAYRGRFAPSPTGRLHLGLARTALLGWLRARSKGGAFVLRIEDLDGPRVVAGSAESILDDLRWMGLDWDEGPDVDGPHGPYVQSQRLARYDAAIDALSARGQVYPCTCSRKEIAVASAPHGPAEYGPVYPGTCRNGPRHPERAAAIRLRVPDPLHRCADRFRDGAAPEAAAGDFVVRRADGVHSYQLAVVVDDAAMGVTEVLRGDDLAGCTPWQLALYDALAMPRPAFAHVPLILGPDGRRLAKRHGAIAVAEVREAGTQPEALVGWLAASCGLVPAGTPVSVHALLDGFDLGRIHTTPTRLGPDDLPQPR
jgi:glutamyl-tRNA synthetase